MNGQSRKPLEEVFADFVVSQIAQGFGVYGCINAKIRLGSQFHFFLLQSPSDFSELVQTKRYACS